ncbi:MAG TPA: aminoglycoside N(3)-acetyltransferase, partial [Firmicutes bacterium]|nr:aminoglycoside N(3)-acetyltransferase [Bacillota bacterium]
MAEADAVARSTDGPVTREWLVRDLRALGVRPGMLLMVHASLSGLGWVIGGVVTVMDALRDAAGDDGT